MLRKATIEATLTDYTGSTGREEYPADLIGTAHSEQRDQKEAKQWAT